MTWALAIPKASLDNPAARHVLLCLANYAGSDGRGAFPSAGTLSEDTGLSERTVRLKLDELEKGGFIVEGNQAIAAAYIDRRDRRPVVYDLQLKRGANTAPRKERGAADRTGCSSQQNGVQENAERGAAAAPNPSLNHQLTEEQQPRDLAGVIEQQDRQAIEPQEDRQHFAMFAEWNPPTNLVTAQLKLAGLTFEVLTEEALQSFLGYYIAKPQVFDSNGGWCFRLAKWVKTEKAKGAAAHEEAGTDWTKKGVRV
ncbi:DnaT-like ssDNA-binding domain-containing protein [Pseudomonas sp. SD17-1]|uniref:helix-turn-helix domain-containing protein n=1 Tax=Pseudomonas sp. SD17-1 TaxID=2976883 RepID=UPI0023DB0E2E|nr:helix-turn-helix domain-containing protein [Pseudomonas sp. SD17-1]WEJ23638.1 DnaT-like ssDNA-binding domain-containing protein [Pseudomonas sp. SD17-1]